SHMSNTGERYREAKMESLRYGLMRAVVEAMHFDTPEGISTPGEFIAVIEEIDKDDTLYAMKKAGEDAVDKIIETLKNYGLEIPDIVRERRSWTAAKYALRWLGLHSEARL